MIATKVETIKNRLVQELNVNIKINWLDDCVNYFVQDNPEIQIDSLYKSARTQLLLANYQHACDPVIPNAFRTGSAELIWTFKETLFLQMQFILDICKFLKIVNIYSLI